MIKIRKAEMTDLSDIHQLITKELGYNYAIERMQIQLEHVLTDNEQVLLVAATADNHIIGIVHATPYQSIYFDPALNILALAVQEAFHGKGIGRQLMTAVEIVAKERAISLIRLNSGNHRRKAHTFYQCIGYELRKTQAAFYKELN